MSVSGLTLRLPSRAPSHESRPLLGRRFRAVSDPNGYNTLTRVPSRKPSIGGSEFSRVFSEAGAVYVDVDVDEVEEGEEEVDGADELEDENGEIEYKSFGEIWAVCLGLWTAVFCSALSGTIVANLQLEISSYFSAGSLASWLGTAFLLGLTAMTPLCGRLVGIIGQKGTLLLTLFLFLVGTLLCAIAPSMTSILVARAIAGAGSGGLLTVVAIVLSALVSPADRGLYQAGGSVLFGAGSAAGAVIGGAVADEWGWRAAFWVQVPPIVLAIALVVWQVEVDEAEGVKEEDLGERDEGSRGISVWARVKKIDWLGCGVLMVSITSVTIAASLISTPERTFTHPHVLFLLSLSVLTFALFLVVEAHAAEPVLPLGLATRGQPALILLAFGLLTATWFARLYMQPVYLQICRGMDPLESGMLLLPFSITGSLVSVYVGWHMRYFREYKWSQVLFSALAWIQGLSVILTWGIDTDKDRLLWELATTGLVGATFTSLMTALVVAVPAKDISIAISACYLFRAVGQVFGVSLASLIQQSLLVSTLQQSLPENSTDLIWRIVEKPTTVIPMLDEHLAILAREAYMASLRGVFAGIVAGGVLLTGICVGIRSMPL